MFRTEKRASVSRFVLLLVLLLACLCDIIKPAADGAGHSLWHLCCAGACGRQPGSVLSWAHVKDVLQLPDKVSHGSKDGCCVALPLSHLAHALLQRLSQHAALRTHVLCTLMSAGVGACGGPHPQHVHHLCLQR